MESEIFNPGEEYIRLAFQLDHYLKTQLGDNTIIVDCYFGPPNLKPEKKKVDPDNLMKSIRQLRESVKSQIRENPRRTYLIKQLDAMTLLVKYGLGENVSFEERVKTGLILLLLSYRQNVLRSLVNRQTEHFEKRFSKAI